MRVSLCMCFCFPSLLALAHVANMSNPCVMCLDEFRESLTHSLHVHASHTITQTHCLSDHRYSGLTRLTAHSDAAVRLLVCVLVCVCVRVCMGFVLLVLSFVSCNTLGLCTAVSEAFFCAVK